MTHDRRTHDLPTSLLTLAQQCEAEASEWLDEFTDLDDTAATLITDKTTRQLRVQAAACRLARQAYIDTDENSVDAIALRAGIRTARAYVEASEAARRALAADLADRLVSGP